MDQAKIPTDLVMALALGGDCLADIAVLRSQQEMVGPGSVGPGGVPADHCAGRGHAAGDPQSTRCSPLVGLGAGR